MTPQIIYNSILVPATATLAASSTAEGYNVQNIKDQRINTSWKANAGGSQSITITPAAQATVEAFGIAAHNLKTAAATITLQYYSGSTWITIRTLEVANDNVLIWKFNAVTGTSFRMQITSTTAPQIGIMFLGSALSFVYPPDTPHAPYNESIIASSAVSKEGIPLGTVVKYNPLEIQHIFTNFGRTWLNNYYEPFWNNHGKLLKWFFYATDLDNAPADMFYCRMKDEQVHSPQLSNAVYVDSINLNMMAFK